MSKRMVDSVYLKVNYKCCVEMEIFTNNSLQPLRMILFRIVHLSH